MDAAHESLLRIPLVAEMLTDDSVVLTPRQVDGGWREVRPLHMAVSGFQPFLSRLFYPARSSVATWLADPSGPTRRLNLRDRLVKDVLMLAHDYLHILASATPCARSARSSPGSASATGASTPTTSSSTSSATS